MFGGDDAGYMLVTLGTCERESAIGGGVTITIDIMAMNAMMMMMVNDDVLPIAI